MRATIFSYTELTTWKANMLLLEEYEKKNYIMPPWSVSRMCVRHGFMNRAVFNDGAVCQL